MAIIRQQSENSQSDVLAVLGGINSRSIPSSSYYVVCRAAYIEVALTVLYIKNQIQFEIQ